MTGNAKATIAKIEERAAFDHKAYIHRGETHPMWLRCDQVDTMLRAIRNLKAEVEALRDALLAVKALIDPHHREDHPIPQELCEGCTLLAILDAALSEAGDGGN